MISQNNLLLCKVSGYFTLFNKILFDTSSSAWGHEGYIVWLSYCDNNKGFITEMGGGSQRHKNDMLRNFLKIIPIISFLFLMNLLHNVKFFKIGITCYTSLKMYTNLFILLCVCSSFSHLIWVKSILLDLCILLICHGWIYGDICLQLSYFNPCFIRDLYLWFL